MVIHEIERRAEEHPVGEAEHVFSLDGGWLALDFVNTLSNRLEEIPTERLRRFDDLVAWSRQSGTIDADEAALLRKAAAARPAEASAVVERARHLREALHDVFASLAAGQPLEPARLEALNLELAARLACSRLELRDGAFAWSWGGDRLDFDRLLWYPARSAADLLTSSELGNTRECASDSCAWLFLDNTRNRSRRWCDMQVCGNRAKARRHYARRKNSILSPDN